MLNLITDVNYLQPVADPGFPVGGVYPLGGCGPPTQALFTRNVCKNEKIGSHRGVCTGHAPRSANGNVIWMKTSIGQSTVKYSHAEIDIGFPIQIW